MAPNILRRAADIPSATTADLVATYNAYSATPVKRFENRAVAERRVEMALLAAIDRTGHAGVPANTTVVVPKTNDEMAPASPKPEPPQPNPPAPTSKRAKLAAEMALLPPIIPRPKAIPAPGSTARPAFTEFWLAPQGRTKLQSGSDRAVVYNTAKALVEEDLSRRVGFEALCEAFGFGEDDKLARTKLRGHLQKLREVGWIAPAGLE